MRGRTQRARARRRRGRRHRDPRRPPRGRQRGADHGWDRPLAERRDTRGHAAGHRSRSPGHRRSAPRGVARTARPRDALSRRRRPGGSGARCDPPGLAARRPRIAGCAPAGPPPRGRASRRREWRAESWGSSPPTNPPTTLNLAIAPEVSAALAAGGPVVALESTVIAHGLPRPRNLETAHALEADIHALGATPATIALSDGRAVVGAGDVPLEPLANEDGVVKTSLRDIAPVLAARGVGATTVAATVEIAARVGIHVMATGGIGGVHRGAERSFDESADLEAIARNPVCVVSAGAKLVLDLALTLERLETLGVPVIGYVTDDLPAFYVRSSGLRLAHRVNDALGAARIAREQLARGAGMVLAVPVAPDVALDRDTVERDVARAIATAERSGVRGADLTPFLLRALGEATAGRALDANVALLRANARVAAQLALALCA